MVRKPNLLLPIVFILMLTHYAQAQRVVTLQQGKHTSIRGLSVVDDKVAWVSGSGGNIAITKDGGKTWDWQLVKGYEKSDFRDIEAFSAKEAIIMSSGTPALILKTKDGGATWQEKYRNADTAYFFDAMDFSGKKHGLILGDPINGKFVLMETNDSGEHWQLFKNPPAALPGEAAFAASGTCLRMAGKEIYIVTGGKAARIIAGNTNSGKWDSKDLPLIQGKPSQGAFSVADVSVIIGGDYANDKATEQVVCYLSSGGTYAISANPAGFQSCVEYIKGGVYLATGTPGSSLSDDGGKTWTKIDAVSYNVCRKAKHGTLVLFAGDRGKIGVFKP